MVKDLYLYSFFHLQRSPLNSDRYENPQYLCTRRSRHSYLIQNLHIRQCLKGESKSVKQWKKDFFRWQENKKKARTVNDIVVSENSILLQEMCRSHFIDKAIYKVHNRPLNQMKKGPKDISTLNT